MSTAFKIAAAFVVGAVCGGTATYFVVKDKIKREADEDMAEVREYYRKKYNEPAEKDEEETKETPEQPSEELRTRYSTIASSYSPNSRDEEAKSFEYGDPRPITSDEYGEYGDEYEQVPVTYYAKSKILADERNVEIDDPEDTVADIEWLDEQASYHDDITLYTRNDVVKCDYEIYIDRETDYFELLREHPEYRR